MQIEVWFTTQAKKEAARMTRRSYSWLWIVFDLRLAFGIALVLLWGCDLLLDSLFTHGLLRGALGIVTAAVLAAGSQWLLHRKARKAAEELAAINPQNLTFEADGLHTLEKTGASSFVPWSTYRGFREGESVILLFDAGSAKNCRIIPKKTVPESGVEELRSAIREHLPEIH